jgi:hypothetical protein
MPLVLTPSPNLHVVEMGRSGSSTSAAVSALSSRVKATLIVPTSSLPKRLQNHSPPRRFREAFPPGSSNRSRPSHRMSDAASQLHASALRTRPARVVTLQCSEREASAPQTRRPPFGDFAGELVGRIESRRDDEQLLSSEPTLHPSLGATDPPRLAVEMKATEPHESGSRHDAPAPWCNSPPRISRRAMSAVCNVARSVGECAAR